MADPMKPKRGQTHVEAFGRTSGTVPLLIGDMAPQPWLVPVLVIPDPDRDPTPEEIEALARRLHESEAWGGTFDADRTSCLIAARAAWRLGARVPS